MTATIKSTTRSAKALKVEHVELDLATITFRGSQFSAEYDAECEIWNLMDEVDDVIETFNALQQAIDYVAEYC